MSRPKSAKTTTSPPAAAAASSAARRRAPGVRPAVRLMKIGALPRGSMMTSSVMKASANARQFIPSAYRPAGIRWKEMAKKTEDLLWKLAESDEVEIETRRDAKSPLHRTTIWTAPTEYGVYIRSYKGKKGRWYQEAIANPRVTIRVGRRKATARAEPEHNPLVVRAVNAGYRRSTVNAGPRRPRKCSSARFSRRRCD